MPEAVIVATARSPIGRAMKGSLVDMRPDELAAQMVTAALDQVPQLDRTTIEDLMLGNGQPAGEAGFNLARAVAQSYYDSRERLGFPMAPREWVAELQKKAA